jgi:hypothetical protein
MDPSTLGLYQVGQYWFEPPNVIHRVTEVTQAYVRFDDGCRVEKPLGGKFTWLWHEIIVPTLHFGGVSTKPGQTWVCMETGEVFFIHPDQESTDGGVRILSSTVGVRGESFLLLDAPREVTQADADRAMAELRVRLEMMNFDPVPTVTISNKSGWHLMVMVHQTTYTKSLPIEVNGVPVIVDRSQ